MPFPSRGNIPGTGTVSADLFKSFAGRVVGQLDNTPGDELLRQQMGLLRLATILSNMIPLSKIICDKRRSFILIQRVLTSTTSTLQQWKSSVKSPPSVMALTEY